MSYRTAAASIAGRIAAAGNLRAQQARGFLLRRGCLLIMARLSSSCASSCCFDAPMFVSVVSVHKLKFYCLFNNPLYRLISNRVGLFPYLAGICDLFIQGCLQQHRISIALSTRIKFVITCCLWCQRNLWQNSEHMPLPMMHLAFKLIAC